MKSLIDLNLTQPITELIKVVSSAIGTLYRPRKIRKEAEAEAYAIEVKERAKTNAEFERREKELELDAYALEITEQARTNAEIERREKLSESDQRIFDRLISQERVRQKNIDDVFDIAAHKLSSENEVPHDQVDVDWAIRFINNAQDISREELKIIWGHLLAGEIKKPGTFSLRTLESLRNLNAKEAALFHKISRYILNSTGEHALFLFNNDNLFKEIGITPDEIFTLIDAGLLISLAQIDIRLHETAQEEFIFVYQNLAIKSRITSSGKYSVLLLSAAGEQIYSLIEDNDIDMDYLKAVTKFLGRSQVKFSGYKIKRWEDKDNFDVEEAPAFVI